MNRDNFCIIRSIYIKAGVQFEQCQTVLASLDTLTKEDKEAVTKCLELSAKIQEELSAIIENE